MPTIANIIGSLLNDYGFSLFDRLKTVWTIELRWMVPQMGDYWLLLRTGLGSREMRIPVQTRLDFRAHVLLAIFPNIQSFPVTQSTRKLLQDIAHVRARSRLKIAET